MRLIQILRLRLRSLYSRRAVDRELDEELQYHLDREIQENIASGMTAAEAMRLANGLTQRREECRDARGFNLVDNVLRDTRFALRQLRKNPAFASTAILVMTLGIAASVAIFAFVDAALIKPLPYKNPARLMQLHEIAASGNCDICTVSYLDFADWKRLATSYSSMAAYRYGGFMVTTPEGTESTTAFRVTDAFFRTLGVAPILGRDFYPGEDALGAPRTILLSYSTWQHKYGGKPDVLGKSVILNDTPFAIVGVLPHEFHFAASVADYWLPLRPFAGSCEVRRSCHGEHVIARLNDGISIETASSELKLIARQLEKQFPDSNRGQGAGVLRLSESLVGEIRPILLLLLAGAALLLLIANINVSSLLLVRAESRKREIAVRGALGASHSRIVGQFVTEGLILVAAAGTLGVTLASWAMHLLITLIPAGTMFSLPFLLGIGLNPRVLAFAGLIALLSAILFTLTPALHFSLTKTRDGIVQGTRGSSGQTWSRVGSKLVMVELATAVVLLVGAGLLIKSFYRLLHVDLGMQPDRVVTIQVAAPSSYAASEQKANSLEPKLVGGLAELPGVKSVGLSSGLPVQDGTGAVWLVVDGKPIRGAHNEVPEREVNSAYFATLGAKLARGRYFTAAEDAQKPEVAIVNQTFQRIFFPGEDPIGKQLMYERTGAQVPMRIVGVVEDVREGQLDAVMKPILYVPFVHYVGAYFNVLVRTTGPEKPLLAALNTTIHQIDPNLVTKDAATLTDLIADSQAAYLHRSSAVLVGGFAALALLLAAVGLYGVVAYSVSQRTREIGVRMALGADRSSVAQLVLREALKLTSIGIAAGVLCSLAAATLIRSLLFGVRTWDVPTLGAVILVIGFLSLAASYVPARRAASVNPSEALRAE